MIQCTCAIWHTLRTEFWKSDIILWFNAHARSDIRWEVNVENLIWYNAHARSDIRWNLNFENLISFYDSMRVRDLKYAEIWISKIWYNSMIQCACAIWYTLEMWISKIWYNSMIQCACAIWHTLRCEFRKSDINLWFNAHARFDIRRDVKIENHI